MDVKPRGRGGGNAGAPSWTHTSAAPRWASGWCRTRCGEQCGATQAPVLCHETARSNSKQLALAEAVLRGTMHTVCSSSSTSSSDERREAGTEPESSGQAGARHERAVQCPQGRLTTNESQKDEKRCLTVDSARVPQDQVACKTTSEEREAPTAAPHQLGPAQAALCPEGAF